MSETHGRSTVKVNFGCFNSNLKGWIGVDHAMRHIIVSRIPLAPLFLWKSWFLNDQQYDWHRKRSFNGIRDGDVRKKLLFRSGTVDYIYSSHMLEHLFRDEAIRFLRECHRILHPGAAIRLCLPSWDIERKKSDFLDSLFAKNRRELKFSHKWLWSGEELLKAMSDIGFEKVQILNYREGDFPDLEAIEHRSGLIVQGQKQGGF